MKFNSLKIKTNHTKPVKGFTLIELMVSVAIFAVVAVVSISSLSAINYANKKAQTMRAIIDNLNFAMENMARSLRVGTTYHCDYQKDGSGYPRIYEPLDCPSPSGSIAFESYDGDPGNANDQIVYGLDPNTGQIMKSKDSGTTFLPLTPHIDSPLGGFQPLTINYLHFYVAGSTENDGIQPRVVIVVGGTAYYDNKTSTDFQLETSVTQRRIDS